jgi:hypothetical protein
MPESKTTRLYRIDPYDCFVYSTTKRKAKKHFEEKTNLIVKKVVWQRFKKIKLFKPQAK